MTIQEGAERALNHKSRVGTVVSDKNDKTIVVEIERATRHRIYRKVVRSTKKYHVHDEANRATLGDLVRIEECRPISRLKRWQLMEVLTERTVANVAPESLDAALVEEMQRSASRAQAEDETQAVAAPVVSDPEAGGGAAPMVLDVIPPAPVVEVPAPDTGLAIEMREIETERAAEENAISGPDDQSGESGGESSKQAQP